MKFVKQTFADGVTLDFNEFIDCEIKDCVVAYYGGKFTLVRTQFNNVRFAVGGSANDTLVFLNLVRAHGEDLLKQLLDKRGKIAPDITTAIN